MSIFEKVETFNREVIGINGRDVREIEKDEFAWLVGALSEEVDELRLAYAQHDFVGQIDAVVDLIYFAAGALTRMGLYAKTSEEIFEAVHACNMLKKKGIKEERDIKSDLDAVKPENWSDPSAVIMDILNEIKRG